MVNVSFRPSQIPKNGELWQPQKVMITFSTPKFTLFLLSAGLMLLLVIPDPSTIHYLLIFIHEP